MAKQRGKRVTLEEAIAKDRKAFIALLKRSFFGAGPEDYKEYDFEDIGD